MVSTSRKSKAWLWFPFKEFLKSKCAPLLQTNYVLQKTWFFWNSHFEKLNQQTSSNLEVSEIFVNFILNGFLMGRLNGNCINKEPSNIWDLLYRIFNGWTKILVTIRYTGFLALTSIFPSKPVRHTKATRNFRLVHFGTDRANNLTTVLRIPYWAIERLGDYSSQAIISMYSSVISLAFICFYRLVLTWLLNLAHCAQRLFRSNYSIISLAYSLSPYTFLILSFEHSQFYHLLLSFRLNLVHEASSFIRVRLFDKVFLSSACFLVSTVLHQPPLLLTMAVFIVLYIACSPVKFSSFVKFALKLFVLTFDVNLVACSIFKFLISSGFLDASQLKEQFAFGELVIFSSCSIFEMLYLALLTLIVNEYILIGLS